MRGEPEQLRAYPHMTPDSAVPAVNSLIPSQNGQVLSLASDGIARLWATDSTLLGTFGAPSPVLGAAWAPKGGYFALLFCHQLSVYDPALCERPYVLEGLRAASWKSAAVLTVGAAGGLYELTVAGKWTTLLTSNATGTVEELLWNNEGTFMYLKTGALAGVWNDSEVWSLGAGVQRAVWVPHSELLVAFGNTGMSVLSAVRREVLRTVNVYNTGVDAVKVRKDGGILAVVCGSVVDLWNAEKGLKLRSLQVEGTVKDM